MTESADRWKKGVVAALLFAALAVLAGGATAYVAFQKASQLAQVQAALAAAREEKLASELREQGARAANAEKSTAEAQQRAAEAERKTEALRLEIARTNEVTAEINFEISQIKIPRVLSMVQRRAAVERLKPFARTQFDMALNPDTETRDLFVQIEDTLTAAGWTETDWAGTSVKYVRDKRRAAGIVSATGVIIQMHPAQVSKLRSAADALAAALQAEGIFAVAQLGLGIKNDNPAALHVLVGMKPQQ